MNSSTDSNPDPARQGTIGKPFTFTGSGIHTGEQAKVTVIPGEINQGIIFQKGLTSIPATVENVSSTLRSTCLLVGDESVSTVEHFLAACVGMGVDNLTVKIEGRELPAFDGSSLEFVRMLKEAGIVQQDALRAVVAPDKLFTLRQKESFITFFPDDHLSITVVVDFENPAVGMQMAQFNPQKDDFEQELAPARTFGFKEEIEKLQKSGLALGGSLQNALVISEEGYVNQPRFPNEVARHKCLDLMGDFALAGAAVVGHIFAFKPSHRLNTVFIRKLIDKKDLKAKT